MCLLQFNAPDPRGGGQMVTGSEMKYNIAVVLHASLRSGQRCTARHRSCQARWETAVLWTYWFFCLNHYHTLHTVKPVCHNVTSVYWVVCQSEFGIEVIVVRVFVHVYCNCSVLELSWIIGLIDASNKQLSDKSTELLSSSVFPLEEVHVWEHMSEWGAPQLLLQEKAMCEHSRWSPVGFTTSKSGGLMTLQTHDRRRNVFSSSSSDKLQQQSTTESNRGANIANG